MKDQGVFNKKSICSQSIPNLFLINYYLKFLRYVVVVSYFLIRREGTVYMHFLIKIEYTE